MTFSHINMVMFHLSFVKLLEASYRFFAGDFPSRCVQVFRFVLSILLDPRFCAEKRFHYLARDAVPVTIWNGCNNDDFRLELGG